MAAVDPRANRVYGTSPLPTLRDGLEAKTHRDVLLALYQQTCQSWRHLVDVRFKLLALVPSVALASLGLVLASDGRYDAVPVVLRLLFSAIGLASTLGLWLYDARNSELHDELISRARKIEEELGLHTGAFLGRPAPRSDWVCHDRATTLIYGAAFVAWIGTLGVAIVRALL
jgi:hypothetical protein